MSDPANLLGALALAIADAQTRGMGEDLSEAALAVLNTLHVAPGCSIATLAAVTGRSHSVTVRTVEALQAAGYIARRPGPDRRTASLVLTGAGSARRGALQSGRSAAIARALAPLDPAERTALAALAGRMLAALTGSRAEGDRICRLCDEDACGPDCPVEARSTEIEGPRP
jgi:DNA-binding MarR family transcriptional regulator